MLLRALGTKQDARYNLKIVNTDDDGSETPRMSKAVHDELMAQARPSDEDDFKAAEIEKEEEAELEDDEEDETTASALTEKTRAELAELDDLDI